MLNKKRLAMMAVAASMVLPNNLVYLATNTPVFAEGVTADNINDTTKALDTALGLEEGTITLNSSKKYYILPTKDSYSLNKDITIDKPFLITDNKVVKMDLNNHSITTAEANYIFLIWGTNGGLTLTGTGTLTNNTSGESAVIKINEGFLTIDENSNIKLEATSSDEGSYGIAIYHDAKTETKVNNAEISAQNGIYVSGNLTPETSSTLDLNNVKIDAKGHGIYHAGAATTTITGEKTNIKGGTVGVEVRAGTLTVSEGTISGSTEKPLEVEGNGNGSTTLNAGVAVAQHTTDYPITVTLGKEGKAPTISGYVGLAITDPQNKQVEGTIDTDITVSVNGATLTGKQWGVAYSTDTIPFTLTNTVCDSIQKVNADGTTFTDEIDPDTIPYKVILELNTGDDDQSATIPSDVLANFAKDGEEEGSQVVTITLHDVPLPDSYADLPLDSFKEEGLSEATLGKALTAQSSQDVEIVDHTGEKVSKAPGYTYTVSNLTELEASSKGIEVKGEPEVKVQVEDESVIKFILPKPETENGEIFPMLEVEENQEDPGQTPEENPNEPTSALYVEVAASGKTAATINDYLLKQANELGQTVHVDSTLNLSGAITLGSDEVTLDENGFIEIQLESGRAPATGNSSSGSHKPKPKPEQPAEVPVVGTPTTMYRLYNRLTGEHLYTIDKNERDNLLTSDTWKDEGEGWIAPSVSDYPVYRLLNPNNGDHHYTTDKNEFDTLPSYGWVAEGVAFFSADKENPENVLLHRLYNPNAEGAGSHHYTADTNERDALVAQGWKYEGLAWAGLPANK